MFKKWRKRIAAIIMMALLVVTMAAMTVTAVASDPPSVGITTEMLTPVMDGVIANIGVVIPVAVGIFGILIGIFLIFRVISRATNA